MHLQIHFGKETSTNRHLKRIFYITVIWSIGFDCTLPCHLIRLSKNIILNALNVYVYHSVQLHVMIKIIKLQKKDNLCFKLHNCVAKRQIVMLKKGTK